MIQRYVRNVLTYITSFDLYNDQVLAIYLQQLHLQQLQAPEEELYISQNVARILLYHVCIVTIS